MYSLFVCYHVSNHTFCTNSSILLTSSCIVNNRIGVISVESDRFDRLEAPLLVLPPLLLIVKRNVYKLTQCFPSANLRFFSIRLCFSTLIDLAIFVLVCDRVNITMRHSHLNSLLPISRPPSKRCLRNSLSTSFISLEFHAFKICHFIIKWIKFIYYNDMIDMHFTLMERVLFW